MCTQCGLNDQIHFKVCMFKYVKMSGTIRDLKINLNGFQKYFDDSMMY